MTVKDYKSLEEYLNTDGKDPCNNCNHQRASHTNDVGRIYRNCSNYSCKCRNFYYNEFAQILKTARGKK